MKPVIICIDDERIILDNLKVELSEQFGQEYDVELADGGADGLELTDQLLEEGRKVALVICDYRMPLMTGDEVLEQLMQKIPQAALMILTGHADMDMLIKTVNKARLDGLLNKPWSREELAAIVRTALSNFSLKEELSAKTGRLARKQTLLNIASNVARIGSFQWEIPTGTIQYSDEWLEVMGYQPHEVGNTLDDYMGLVHHDDRSRLSDELQKMINGEEDRIFLELKMRDADQVWRWIHFYGQIYASNDQGEAQTVVGVNQDVTRQKNTEILLIQARGKSDVLENLSEHVIVLTPEMKLMWSNHLPRSLESKADDPNCVMDWLKQECSGDQDVPLKALHGRKTCAGEIGDLQGHIYEINAAPKQDSQGNVGAIIVTLRNVTENRQMEQELSHSRKMEAIGSLAAGIAHEINTPIQYIGDNLTFLGKVFDGISSGIQSCREDAVSGKQTVFTKQFGAGSKNAKNMSMVSEAVIDALEGVGHVAKIVGAMKEYSHPQADSAVSVNLDRLIDNAVVISRNEWKYCADIDKKCEDKLEVMGFSNDLSQVLINMIVNAAHAIEERIEKEGQTEKGRIQIGARQNGDCVEITISDNGAGILPEHKERIFDLFYTTKDIGKGTGQGLSMVYQIIVQKHGGAIHVDSEPGEGTTFTIMLPCQPEIVKSADDMLV